MRILEIQGGVESFATCYFKLTLELTDLIQLLY